MTDSCPDINAGAWYLRGRHDLAWDVCEPITGEVVAEVAVDPETHELAARGDAAAIQAGTAAVRRFLLQLVAQPGQGFGQ
ncbi:hypothetical protein [Mycolicibacterium sp.]|uniref:hypothetical protein n=1 Tax=Mycolicibacterium sp. TaxID=2320850 RepID=UPI0028A986FD|nr:hypothetical protein [Mycolicibacterium sp.]